jgi:hypothetical protein
MKREEDEKLWDLLGRSSEPTVSPFFARNVLRKIREAQGETSPSRGWTLRWLVPASGVAMVIIAALTFPTQLVERTPRDSAAEVAAADGQDNDLLADLDDLVGPEDSLADDAALLL